MTLPTVNHRLFTALLTAGLLSAGLAQAQSFGGAGEQGAGAPRQGQGQGMRDRQMQGQQMQQQAQSENIDDTTIHHFAEVFQEVQQINHELTEEIATAASTEAAQNMQLEAQRAMAKVVQDSEISITEYNNIASAMRYDAQLAERVRNALEQIN